MVPGPFSRPEPRRADPGCQRSAELLGCVYVMSGECCGVCVDVAVPKALRLVVHRSSVALSVRGLTCLLIINTKG